MRHGDQDGPHYGICGFPYFIEIQPAQGNKAKATGRNEQRLELVMGLFIAWPKGNKDKYDTQCDKEPLDQGIVQEMQAR